VHSLDLQSTQSRRNKIEFNIVLLGAKFRHGPIFNSDLEFFGRFWSADLRACARS
jgi:hypothetical protein